MAYAHKSSPILVIGTKLHEYPERLCFLQPVSLLHLRKLFESNSLVRHDVSWGTKGSDKAEVLPSVVSAKKQDEAVVEDTTQNQEGIDAAFKETVTRAITKVQTKEVVEKPTMDDENSACFLLVSGLKLTLF